jgi:hypothetical protein
MATERIDLPSKGIIYQSDSPLAQGFVEMRYMTAKDEDLLTNPNNRKGGVTELIDKLLQTLIVTKDVNIDDLIEGDRNQLLIAARVLSYGSSYTFKMTSLLDDNKTVSQTVNLSTLEDIKIDFDKFVKNSNKFSYTLPTSNIEICFKLLTHGDVKQIYKESQSTYDLYKIYSDITLRLNKQILSVNGDEKKSTILKFVDEMLASDSRAFRKYYRSISPDVDTVFTYVEDDYTEGGVNLPLSFVDMFFRE